MQRALGVTVAILPLIGCLNTSGEQSKNEESIQEKQNREATTMSTLERVQSWAEEGMSVTPYSQVSVKGLEFFWLGKSMKHGKQTGFGVAVQPGATSWVRGEEAMRLVLSNGVNDAWVLANLSMLLLGEGGKPMRGPVDREGEQAGVRAPAIENQILEYWSTHRWLSKPELERSRVDLATMKLERVVASDLARQTADPIAEAQNWLATNNTTMHQLAVEKLAANCTPQAAQVLGQTASQHPQAAARSEAARLLADCHNTETVSILIGILKDDKDTAVRAMAADTLGAMGNPAAKPALQQAAKDPDLDVQGAASRALNKLK